MSKKVRWTMRRGYAAGAKSVAMLGPPPTGPASGTRASSVSGLAVDVSFIAKWRKHASPLSSGALRVLRPRLRHPEPQPPVPPPHQTPQRPPLPQP
jgi:hypothetical protein